MPCFNLLASCRYSRREFPKSGWRVIITHTIIKNALVNVALNIEASVLTSIVLKDANNRSDNVSIVDIWCLWKSSLKIS